MHGATTEEGQLDAMAVVSARLAFCRSVDSAAAGAGVPRRRPEFPLDPRDPHLRIVRRNMAIIAALSAILWAGIVFLTLFALF